MQLLQHGRLGVDLLELSVLKLLTTSMSHLEVFNGADLLLQAANLLRLRVLGIGSSWGSGLLGRLGCSTTVALALLSVVAVVAVIVPRAAAVLAVVATTPLRAAAVMALLRRGSQAGTAIGFSLQLAVALVVVIVLLAALLFALLRAIIDRLGTWHTTRSRGGSLNRLCARNSTAGATEAIGADILSSIANNVGSTTLILALEVKRSGESSGSRGTVSTSRLAGRLDCTKIGSGRGVRGGDRSERITGCNRLC